MRKPAYIFTVVALIAVLLISGFQLWRRQSTEKEASDPPVATDQPQTPTPSASSEPTASGKPVETAPPGWTVYEQYGDWFIENSDMIGWIKIDGTTIDYPVMQTKDNPDYYLKHGFDKQPNDIGVPYVAAGCIDPQSDNITIVFSGEMYETLQSYWDEAFWREHPTIRFDTFVGFGEYEVFSASKSNSGVNAISDDKLLTLNIVDQLTIVARKIGT
jgi:sortase B